jgi:hypothetical protein
LDTGILLSIFGLVATILFGIVGVLVIRNRLSQRQKATGASSTAIQSGRDTTVNRHQGGNVENAPWGIIINGPTTFNSKPPDAHSDELLKSANVMTIIWGGVSIFYIWDKSHPVELQQTLLLKLAFPAICILVSDSPPSLSMAISKNTLLNQMRDNGYASQFSVQGHVTS